MELTYISTESSGINAHDLLWNFERFKLLFYDNLIGGGSYHW